MAHIFRRVQLNADILPNLLEVLNLILDKADNHVKISEDIYHFDNSVFHKKSHTFGRKSITLINDCLKSHRFEEAAKLLWILCQDRSCFDTVLYKAVMVVLENLKINDKNEIVKKFCNDIQGEKYVNKLEVQLEYILYSIRNNVPGLLKCKKPESKKNTVRMKRSKYLNAILTAYYALLNYISWKDCCEDSSLSSVGENAAVGAINAFKELLEEPGIWDIFILKLVEILEYYNNHSEIEDILKKYIERNPDHVNAHIYLCVYLHKYRHDPEIFVQYAKVLAELCPYDVRVLLLVQTWNELDKNFNERLEILFKFLDYPVNGKNVLGWHLLSSHLEEAYKRKSSAVKCVRSLWDLRGYVWNFIHFKLTDLCSVLESNPTLLAYKVSTLSHLEPDNEYIKEAQKRVPDLRKFELKYEETLSQNADFQLLYKLDENMPTREQHLYSDVGMYQ